MTFFEINFRNIFQSLIKCAHFFPSAHYKCASEGTAPWKNSANFNFFKKTRFFLYNYFKIFKLSHENNFLKYWVEKFIRVSVLEIFTWLSVWFRDSLYYIFISLYYIFYRYFIQNFDFNSAGQNYYIFVILNCF